MQRGISCSRNIGYCVRRSTLRATAAARESSWYGVSFIGAIGIGVFRAMCVSKAAVASHGTRHGASSSCAIGKGVGRAMQAC
jgi:hypothetical protein